MYCNRLNRALPAAAAVLLAAVVAGCAASDSSDDADTRTVESADGTVEVPAEPESIAVLWQPTVAAVTQLGFEPAAALGDPNADGGGLQPFLPEGHDADAVEIVSNSLAEDDVNIEALAGAAPDLVIAASTDVGGQAELSEQLEEIAPTVYLEWDGTGSWRDHLYDVAQVLDAEAAADEVVDEYETAVTEGAEAIAAAHDEPAEVEASLVRLQSDSEIRFETPESFPGQVFDDLGFDRPETQLTPDDGVDFISESYENLDQGDGDAIFVFAAGGYEEPPETFGDGVWSNLDAVAAEQIYAVDYDHWGSSNYYGAQRIVDDVVAAFTGELDPAV